MLQPCLRSVLGFSKADKLKPELGPLIRVPTGLTGSAASLISAISEPAPIAVLLENKEVSYFTFRADPVDPHSSKTGTAPSSDSTSSISEETQLRRRTGDAPEEPKHLDYRIIGSRWITGTGKTLRAGLGYVCSVEYQIRRRQDGVQLY